MASTARLEGGCTLSAAREESTSWSTRGRLAPLRSIRGCAANSDCSAWIAHRRGVRCHWPVASKAAQRRGGARDARRDRIGCDANSGTHDWHPGAQTCGEASERRCKRRRTRRCTHQCTRRCASGEREQHSHKEHLCCAQKARLVSISKTITAAASKPRSILTRASCTHDAAVCIKKKQAASSSSINSSSKTSKQLAAKDDFSSTAFSATCRAENGWRLSCQRRRASPRAHPSSKQDGKSIAHRGASQPGVQQQQAEKTNSHQTRTATCEHCRWFFIFLTEPRGRPRGYFFLPRGGEGVHSSQRSSALV